MPWNRSSHSQNLFLRHPEPEAAARVERQMIAAHVQAGVAARKEQQTGKRRQEGDRTNCGRSANLKPRSWQSVIRANAGSGFVPLILHDGCAERRETFD